METNTAEAPALKWSKEYAGKYTAVAADVAFIVTKDAEHKGEWRMTVRRNVTIADTTYGGLGDIIYTGHYFETLALAKAVAHLLRQPGLTMREAITKAYDADIAATRAALDAARAERDALRTTSGATI